MSPSSRLITVAPLSPALLARTKRAFTTRRVPDFAVATLLSGRVRPRSGDLVLAEVTRLGHHRRLEETTGRRAQLHVGDLILVAYGDRYAPDQFEAEIPLDLGPTNLVAGGGVAATMLSRNASVRPATSISPLGLIGDGRGRAINLGDHALWPITASAKNPFTLSVIGTSMNSGKTTTIHHLVHGFARAGMRPGATKVTGTGSGNDYWVMLDAGAHRMLDFTDAGMTSTFRQPMSRIEEAMLLLLAHLTESGTGINLVEVADGIYQDETSQLLESAVFHEAVDAVIFAASDAGGAVAGVQRLREVGLPVVAVSGVLTKSPLAMREAERATGLPALDLAALGDAARTTALLGLPLPVSEAQPVVLPVRPSLAELEQTYGEVVDLRFLTPEALPTYDAPVPLPSDADRIEA